MYAQRSVSGAGTDQTFNSMIYDHVSATSVQLRVNNKLFPYQPFEPTFSANGSFVARPYEELVKYMSKNYNVDCLDYSKRMGEYLPHLLCQLWKS